MQNYQVFWSQEIAGGQPGQLLIDWDLFVRNFRVAVLKHTHYQLNPTQLEFIKCKIDPRQTNQIYKNAFLLFAQDYWDVPSNRTRLFKMKINLSALPRLTFMTGSSPQRIFLSARYTPPRAPTRLLTHELREDKLYQLDSKGFELSDQPVQERGFLSIGADQHNDLRVEDSLFLNKEHLKLVSVRREKKGRPKNMFEEKEPPVELETEWFIRDTARSNRLRYLLDNPWKYVVAKPGMVLSIGLTEDIQLTVEKIGFNAGSVSFSETDYNQLMGLLNADRINYMGEVDPKVPLKTVLDIDFRQVTAVEIETLFKDGHYYPEFREEGAKKKAKEAPTLTFSILNKRTFQSTQYIATDNAFTVGRSKECTYRLDQVSIRSQELSFQFLNNFWTLRSPHPTPATSLSTNVSSVYLASSANLADYRNSNRIRLREGYPYVLRARQFDLEVELREPEGREEE